MLHKIFITVIALLLIFLSVSSILLFVYACCDSDVGLIVVGIMLMMLYAFLDLMFILFIVPKEEHKNEKGN